MKFKKLPGTDVAVSDLCLGTMTWGQQNTEADAHAQLDLSFARGINFIDTAEIYPVPVQPEKSGLTETYLGTWLKKHKRDKVILATKVAGAGVKHLLRAGSSNLCRENIELAVEESLRRLQTDYIDLYQLHSPDRNVPPFAAAAFDPSRERPMLPIVDQVATMAALVKAGKIRHWGVCNESAWGVAAMVRAAEELGAPKPVTIQNGYNLLERGFEPALSEFCFRDSMGLLAYSPLAGGVLTGKYAGGAKPTGARYENNRGFSDRWVKSGRMQAAEAYANLARKHGLDPAVMAIAFVRQQWFVTSALFGATRLEMLETNLKAADVDLSADVLAEIQVIYADSH